MTARKILTPEQKVAIVREHLLESSTMFADGLSEQALLRSNCSVGSDSGRRLSRTGLEAMEKPMNTTAGFRVIIG